MHRNEVGRKYNMLKMTPPDRCDCGYPLFYLFISQNYLLLTNSNLRDVNTGCKGSMTLRMMT